MKGIFFCDCSETPIPIQIQTLFHVRVIKIIIVLIFYINHEPNLHFHAHLCMMSTLFYNKRKVWYMKHFTYTCIGNRFFYRLSMWTDLKWINYLLHNNICMKINLCTTCVIKQEKSSQCDSKPAFLPCKHLV